MSEERRISSRDIIANYKVIPFIILAAIVIFFGLILPTSNQGNFKDYGILVKEHKKVAKEFGDDFSTLLAISTVNTDNELTDEYNPVKSVVYLRKLTEIHYTLTEVTDSKGNTRTRKIITKRIVYRGESLIRFLKNYVRIQEDDPFYSSNKLHKILKFQEEITPKKSSSGEEVEYIFERLTKNDIIYPNEEKQKWFEFLTEEGIIKLYTEDMEEALEELNENINNQGEVNKPTNVNWGNQKGGRFNAAGTIKMYYYNQYKDWYANNMYGPYGTMKQAGCGPTNVAMVTTAVSGHPVDPWEVAQWSVKHGYRSSGGTSWNLVSDYLKQEHGISTSRYSKYDKNIDQTVLNALKEGKPVILMVGGQGQGGTGIFTHGGHFLTLQGVDPATGKVYVYDSGSTKRTNQLWDIKTVIGECKTSQRQNIWIVEKKGEVN